jgi:hypothetical protein
VTKTTVGSAEPNDVDSFLSAMEQSRSYIASANIIKEIARLARLGAAVEAGSWYRCSGCSKPFANPPARTAPKEHVNIQFREVQTWTGEYCSDACHDADPKKTRSY